MDTQVTAETDVVLFDGECRLCSRAARAVARRDRAGRFRLVPLGSDAASAVLARAVRPDALPDSLLLVRADGAVLVESDAVVAIAARLDGVLRHAASLRHIPQPARDAVYRCVARLRGRCR